MAPVRGDAGMFGHLGVSIDVTEQRRVAAEARAALERTALALAAGRMGTWDWDVAADRVVWDEQECRLFGLRPGDPPPTGDAFFAMVHPEDRGALVEACERAARTGEGYEVEYRIGLPDGSVRWLAERCAVMRDEQDRLARVVGITYDVTDRRIQEERIRVLAMHDPLTGLPNRRTLREVLARELAQAAGGRGGPALLLVDLDEFKRVNDTLGHATGDELLVEVARRLLGSVRAGDVVARLGGDEFAIVAADAGGTAGLTTMAERLVASLEARSRSAASRCGRGRASASRRTLRASPIRTSCSPGPTWPSTPPRRPGATPGASSARPCASGRGTTRRSSATCGARSSAASSSSASSRSSTPSRSRRGPPRRSPAGGTRSAAWSRRAASCRRPSATG